MNEARQREPRIEVPWLTEMARGRPCMFRVEGVCNGDEATTVWAHSNRSRHGKGKGLKSHDCHGAFSCSSCHRWYDNQAGFVPADEKDEAFDRAKDKTLEYIFRNNLVRATFAGRNGR